MNFTVYILYSYSAKKFYAGQTDNFALRLSRHNLGMVKTTKPGVPWIEVWSKVVETRSQALRLERKIKGRGISRFLTDIKFDFKSVIENRGV